MRFVALDVETANPNMASICAVGAATFEDGKLCSETYSLIDPQAEFHSVNVGIHGINKNMVQGAPTFGEFSANLSDLMRDAMVVTHTHFDRVAIRQAAQRWQVSPPSCSWLNSAQVVRRTWSACAKSGYGLRSVCDLIGYQFEHHHALEDAKAVGHVLLAAMAESGLDLEGVISRVQQPVNHDAITHNPIKREGDPNGSLFGETVVFTGTLEIPRREAADMAAQVGCGVASSVTKKTTLLVMGDLDAQRLAGHEKSSKHRKAEALIAQGFPIRIIVETDFRELVSRA